MVKLFGAVLAAALPGAIAMYGESAMYEGVVYREFVSPSACSTPGCNYDCAVGYTASQQGSNLTLTSTYSGDDCICDVGTGTVSGDSATGSFASGAVLFTAEIDGHDIIVTATGYGVDCRGIYDIASGTMLGIDGSHADVAGAASVVAGALALTAAVVAYVVDA
jgi:hypothetical protein